MCRVLELGSADKKVTKIFYQKLLAQQLSASVQLCNSNLAKKKSFKNSSPENVDILDLIHLQTLGFFA
jgi:hypothetical protein